jgi:hypothetical protein
MLVWDRNEDVAAYVQGKVGIIIYPPFTALGTTNRAGEITAGIVFNCWNGADVDLTIANDGGLNRSLIYATARYVFNDMKCSRGTIIVRKKDQKTYETALKFGFKPEGEKRLGFGDDDAVIMGMVKAECPWWKEN